MVKYNYRSCEDIVEAVKPLADKHGCTLNITDTIELIGERYYVMAKATLIHRESGQNIWSYGEAREASVKKGMDESQITGAASSYARKYALNGLFCIDDTKDSDATNDQSERTAHKGDDFRGLARQLWSTLSSMKIGDVDQAVNRAVHAHKGNDKALYAALGEILETENQKG